MCLCWYGWIRVARVTLLQNSQVCYGLTLSKAIYVFFENIHFIHTTSSSNYSYVNHFIYNKKNEGVGCKEASYDVPSQIRKLWCI